MVDPRVRPFRGPIAAFAAMLAIVAGTAAVLFARKMGVRPAQVEAFYLGSEAVFSRPRSLEGLLEVAVPHLLAVPLALFATLHLVAFAGVVRRRPFALLSGLTFGCALAGILSGFGIRFLWPGLAWAKIAAFVGLEATLVLWCALLVSALVPGPNGARRAEGQVPLPGRPG